MPLLLCIWPPPPNLPATRGTDAHMHVIYIVAKKGPNVACQQKIFLRFPPLQVQGRSKVTPRHISNINRTSTGVGVELVWSWCVIPRWLVRRGDFVTRAALRRVFHIDDAGDAQCDAERGWRSAGSGRDIYGADVGLPRAWLAFLTFRMTGVFQVVAFLFQKRGSSCVFFLIFANCLDALCGHYHRREIIFFIHTTH